MKSDCVETESVRTSLPRGKIGLTNLERTTAVQHDVAMTVGTVSLISNTHNKRMTAFTTTLPLHDHVNNKYFSGIQFLLILKCSCAYITKALPLLVYFIEVNIHKTIICSCNGNSEQKVLYPSDVVAASEPGLFCC